MRGKTLLLVGFCVSLFFSLVAIAAPDNIALILDASNSMNKPFDGDTRLAAAKEALVRLFGVLPDGVSVRLSAYGHRIDREDRVASCEDIEPLFPLRPFDQAAAEQITAALEQIVAKGLTPLSKALTEAGNALAGVEGESVIILVSDGEETCDGDPLVVAHMFAEMSPPIAVFVIGLGVDQQARETLQAIAEITGCGYRTVYEAEELFEALFAVVAPHEIVTALPAPAIPAQYACWGITNVIRGTEANDNLYGTPGNDLIYGLGGNDLIMGLGGNDILLGGDGNDILEGGDGSDALLGEAGNDILLAGADDDILCGGPGDDSLEGEAGNDEMCGGTGDDRLLGGSGENLLHCVAGDDILLEGIVVEGPSPSCRALNIGCPQTSPPCPFAPCTSAPRQAAPCSPQPAAEPTCPTPAVPIFPPCPVPSGVKSVDEGASIQLSGTIDDQDCNVVSVLWHAEKGRIDNPTSLTPVYCAPLTDRCEGEDVLIALTATDSCGATGSDSFILHINNVNRPPVAEAGDDVFVDEMGTVRLTCSGSDPDGDALTYYWSVDCGRGILNDPTLLHPTYTAPPTEYCEGEGIVLALTVTDACGASACDTLVVHVLNVNAPPIVDLGPNISMNECTSIRLTPVASDPECEELTYYWVATKGTFDNPNAATPTFTTSQVNSCEGEDVLVCLTVTDRCGASVQDSLTIRVNNVNLPPVVKADP